MVCAPEQLLVDARRGEEDDRYVARALALLHQPRDLEAVHPGKKRVEQDQREIALEQLAQGVFAGRGLDQFVARLIGEDRPQRREIFGPVVHEKDGDRAWSFGHPPIVSHPDGGCTRRASGCSLSSESPGCDGVG